MAQSVTRSTASVQLIIELGGEHGMAPEECLAGTGLSATELARPDAEVEAGQELAVIANLVRALPDVPGLGLIAGTRYHLTTHGIWGFALISSPTLRSAISFGLRYLDLTFAFTRIRLEETPDEALMILDDHGIPRTLRQFLIEREGASIMTLQRDLFSAAIPLHRVEVRYPEPAYADMYTDMFGITPLFDAPANLAAFDPAVLDLPLPQANQLTARICEEQCRELLDRRSTRGGLARRVRDQLLPNAGAFPGLEEVARQLGVSPRTLRRQLAHEGASFRALINEVRMALAEEYLTGDAMTIEEITDRLGYSEPASFTRAFTRDHGVAPSTFRRQLAGVDRPDPTPGD